MKERVDVVGSGPVGTLTAITFAGDTGQSASFVALARHAEDLPELELSGG